MLDGQTSNSPPSLLSTIIPCFLKLSATSPLPKISDPSSYWKSFKFLLSPSPSSAIGSDAPIIMPYSPFIDPTALVISSVKVTAKAII